MNSKIITFAALLIAITVVSSCRNDEYIYWDIYWDNDDEEYDPSLVDTETFPDWTELTHSNAAAPDYNTVFEQNKVLRLDLTISSSNWSSMLSDLSSNISSGNNMMGGNNMDSDLGFTPVWKSCTVTFNDTDWYKVGVRFKGNSSLSTTYSSGNRKLSLKLSFDKYEDDYPALTNQRFYGFKQLNLNNNYNDESLMREKIGAELFRSFGIAAPQTSFCEVYIDKGSGAEYFGLYTIVEEVDDTLIDDTEWFSDGGGNLYKPEDDAASFKSGTYDTSEFNLKTNLTSPDYSDVKALYDALHSSNRTSNQSDWCEGVESAFDVETFLKWLAANTTIQNWDTYGNMTHNYFLYNYNGLLTWIPWDNNEAFQSGNDAIEVDEMSIVGYSWPLIKYLFDVEEYEQMYKDYLREFINEVFITADMQSLYTSYYNLLLDSASREESGKTFFDSSSPSTEFSSAVSTLKSHVVSRTTVVNNYLD
ncbi:MAG: CotH kinase family protein [Rikenellaceae bacterium]